jgi:integrase
MVASELRAGLIRIDPGLTKGGEGRQFPIIAALRDVLERRHKVLREDSPLVFHQDGARIEPRAFHKAWTDACTAAKVTGRIPHDMRRSAVRNLERASIPRKVAMQMGWSPDGEHLPPVPHRRRGRHTRSRRTPWMRSPVLHFYCSRRRVVVSPVGQFAKIPSNIGAGGGDRACSARRAAPRGLA